MAEMSLPKDLETVHDEVRDLASNAVEKTWGVVSAALLALWTLISLAVLGVGAGLGVQGMEIAGAVMLVLGWGGTAITRTMKRRRLAAMARTSLIARAKLERVGLGSEMQALLRSFDVCSDRVEQTLLLPEVAPQASRWAPGFAASRDRLFEIAREEGGLRGTLRRVRRHPELAAPGATIIDLEARIRALRDEADRITLDARSFGERLAEVRQLAAADTSRAAPRTPALGDLIAELDRTATAYKEIEAGERSEATLRAKLAAARTDRERH